MIAELHANDESLLAPAASRYLSALAIEDAPCEKRPLIFARVTKESFPKTSAAQARRPVMSGALLEEVRAAMAQGAKEGGSDDGR